MNSSSQGKIKMLYFNFKETRVLRKTQFPLPFTN